MADPNQSSEDRFMINKKFVLLFIRLYEQVKVYWQFFLGLFLILLYWYSIHPPGFGRPGYLEDLCIDFVRQMMAEQLQTRGHPFFQTRSVMTPFGASIPFMSWTIERDWLGAWFWIWNREFPFLWVYLGVSWIGTYLGVGYLLSRLELKKAAWLVAAVLVLFHVPRHFKLYHHWEMAPTIGSIGVSF